MNEGDEKAIVQHIRGAAVVHTSPFATIAVPTVEETTTMEECEKFVVPFYGVSFSGSDGNFLKSLKTIYQEITPELVEKLLTEFDWRPRLTGAFFAALKQFKLFEDHIGRLLLRSDLCFAGRLYCVALVEFNSTNGLGYLRRYLEYYLAKPDLEYNQGEAMGALKCFDAKNGTKHLDEFLPLWKNYIQVMPWKPDLEKQVANFIQEMDALHEIRCSVGGECRDQE
jgi:hypothetical protein